MPCRTATRAPTFQCCSELLAPDGLMLLQAITIDDRYYELEKATRSFVNTYVFPSGCLPSLTVLRDCVSSTPLREITAEDLTTSYPLTLRRWRERFLAARERVAELGYDERFTRLWELYLSWCEGGFVERRIEDHQLLLAGPARAELLACPELQAAESPPHSRGDRGTHCVWGESPASAA